MHILHYRIRAHAPPLALPALAAAPHFVELLDGSGANPQRMQIPNPGYCFTTFLTAMVLSSATNFTK